MDSESTPNFFTSNECMQFVSWMDELRSASNNKESANM